MARLWVTGISQRINSKHYTIAAIFLIVCALLLRLGFILSNWPVHNSDEAIMMLMAKHINENGEHTTFFYGQNYMGSIEAYVGTIFFRLFGTSVMIMRLSSLIYQLGFLICIYLFVSRLYSKGIALITLLFLVGGTTKFIAFQIQTIGGYPEIPFLAIFIFLISFHLASTYRQTSWRTRIVWYGLWGLTAGLAFWDHPVTIFYIGASGLVLLICCWQELLKWGIWILLIGCIIGAWPLINYNLHAAPGADSLSITLRMSQIGDTPEHTLGRRIHGALFISLPQMVGFSSSCFITNPSFQSLPGNGYICHPIQKALGIGVPSLWIIALLMGAGMLIRLWFIYRQTPWDSTKQREWSKQAAHMSLALAALLTLLSYVRSPSASFDPVNSARYLMLIGISMPTIFWMLWQSTKTIRIFPDWFHQPLRFARIAIILVFCLFSLRSLIYVVKDVPHAQQDYQQYIALQHRLEDMGITRFYSQYWTCNAMIFISQEKLICGDTNPNFTHGYDRYYPYHVMVKREPNPAFVYHKRDAQHKTNLEEKLSEGNVSYERVTVGDYTIYKPSRPIPGLPVYHPE